MKGTEPGQVHRVHCKSLVVSHCAYVYQCVYVCVCLCPQHKQTILQALIVGRQVSRLSNFLIPTPAQNNATLLSQQPSMCDESSVASGVVPRPPQERRAETITAPGGVSPFTSFANISCGGGDGPSLQQRTLPCVWWTCETQHPTN